MKLERIFFNGEDSKNFEFFGDAEVLVKPSNKEEREYGNLTLTLKINEISTNSLKYNPEMKNIFDYNSQNLSSQEKISTMTSIVYPMIEKMLESLNMDLRNIKKLEINPSEGNYFNLKGSAYKKLK